MQKKIHLLILAFSALFFFSHQAKAQEEQKEWTLLVYIIGSNLESDAEAGSTDILEMLLAESTDSVNVVIMTGGSNAEGWQTPRSFLIDNGTQTSMDFEPETQMSDTTTLTQFIDWGTSNYPADRTMLTLWNHGGDIRGYGNDDISGKSFKVPDIAIALDNSEFTNDSTKFDILGFDACLMSNIETQASLKDYAHWYIGSEEQEPGHGWNYTPIIEAMELGDSLSANEIGKVIVDGFIEQAAEEETTALTLAVTDLSMIDTLQNSLDTLFKKLVADGKVQTLHRARARAEEYSKSIKNPAWSQDMVDIGDMMKELKELDTLLMVEVDSVLSRLDSAVWYSRSDTLRPKAMGISIYVPHNILADENELDFVLGNYYMALNLDSTLKSFILDTYLPQALADDNPPGGDIDPDFTFFAPNDLTEFLSGDSISALRVEHDDDLEQVQIILVEEFEGFPDEFIMLGSTHADTIVPLDDGSSIYAYKWDEHWLGINGHPAYISDLHDYEVEDEAGDVTKYTRIHIPAVLNPSTPEERDIILAYKYDEDFNYSLESIIPEVEEQEEGANIVPKERIFLSPGDQVQLLYESFNEVTDEQFFVVDDEAIMTIENGNEDLMLEYDRLEVGNYKIGYVLEDHSQNDTIIFDTKIFKILDTAIDVVQNTGEFELFPNPTTGSFTVQMKEFTGESFDLKLYDITGRLVYSQVGAQGTTEVKLDLSNGFYSVEITAKGQRIMDKLIIQR